MILVYSKRFWISFLIFSVMGFGIDIFFAWEELGAWVDETPWYIKITPCYVAAFVSFLIVVFTED